MTTHALLRIPDSTDIDALPDKIRAAIDAAKFQAHLYQLHGTRVHKDLRILGCTIVTPYDDAPATQHPNPADWLDGAFQQFGVSWEAIAVQSFDRHSIYGTDEDGNQIVVSNDAISYRPVPNIIDWIADKAVHTFDKSGIITATVMQRPTEMPTALASFAGAAPWVFA